MDSELNLDKFSFKFDKENGILYKLYFGIITLNDINLSWEYAIQNNMIPKETKGFILDYRNASFNLDENDHLGIAKYYRDNLDIFRNQKIAILTENYNDIVIPILVEEEDYQYFSKPFSTLEAAIKWVLH